MNRPNGLWNNPLVHSCHGHWSTVENHGPQPILARFWSPDRRRPPPATHRHLLLISTTSPTASHHWKPSTITDKILSSITAPPSPSLSLRCHLLACRAHVACHLIAGRAPSRPSIIVHHHHRRRRPHPPQLEARLMVALTTIAISLAAQAYRHELPSQTEMPLPLPTRPCPQSSSPTEDPMAVAPPLLSPSRDTATIAVGLRRSPTPPSQGFVHYSSIIVPSSRPPTPHCHRPSSLFHPNYAASKPCCLLQQPEHHLPLPLPRLSVFTIIFSMRYHHH